MKWVGGTPTGAKPQHRDEDDTLFYRDTELPANAFPQMADIRRQGKLCDVTLKVTIVLDFVLFYVDFFRRIVGWVGVGMVTVSFRH
jgi:hypothetical protein